eukprot:TRINITY_DN1399_c0_g1_i1.p1 TRINITY_DN1399_c0_g1~~TRINITY_DN1399_c0_g1_i1.p1  ORF type:complete len:161 (-),score=50.42 TRINITY_DN1399_c0_g1_i1:149-631(-)
MSTGKIECQQGKRWNVEGFKGNKEIKLDKVERTQVVYLYNLQDCVVEVTAEKFASISVDKVVRTGIKFNKSIGSVEVVNSQKTQIQGSSPSYLIDKSDGITLFLTPQEKDSQIVTSKAEVNIIYLEGEEPKEIPIPSQFITKYDEKTKQWNTLPTDHVGA